VFGDSLIFEASDILKGDKERERSENVNNSSVTDEFVKLNMQGLCILTNYPGQRIDGDRQRCCNVKTFIGGFMCPPIPHIVFLVDGIYSVPNSDRVLANIYGKK